MRLRAAALLGTLGLLLALAACKPSSLTPFGLGWRKPDSGGGVNGSWVGLTNSGGEVKFSVANNEVSGLLLVHKAGDCSLPFPSESVRADIQDNSFTLEFFPAPAGRIVIDASFSSNDAVAGSYFFEALASAPPCPTTGTGSFAASKAR